MYSLLFGWAEFREWMGADFDPLLGGFLPPRANDLTVNDNDGSEHAVSAWVDMMSMNRFKRSITISVRDHEFVKGQKEVRFGRIFELRLIRRHVVGLTLNFDAREFLTR